MKVKADCGISRIEIKVENHKTGKIKKMVAEVSNDRIKNGRVDIEEDEWKEVE